MKRFVDWRVVYYNKKYDRIELTKCFHVIDRGKSYDESIDEKLFTAYDMKQQDCVEFVFELLDEVDKEHLGEFYVMPVDIVRNYNNINDNDDDDIEFDDVVENYIKFDNKQTKTTYSVLKKQKNERIQSDDRLKFFVKCHSYHVNLGALLYQCKQDAAYDWKRNGNCRTIDTSVFPGLSSEPLNGVPSASFAYTLIKPSGCDSPLLLSLRMANLSVYNNSPKSQTALARASNQPFDDLEPLIDDNVYDIDDDNDNTKNSAIPLSAYVTMHNISDVEINEYDIDTLKSNFFMTDNIIHKLLKETMDECEDNVIDTTTDNSLVFVCNTMLMAQLCTNTTPFDNEFGKDAIAKQVTHLFDTVVGSYCTYMDDTLNRKQSCLLSKDFLFFPVNSHGTLHGSHWAMYFVYKPFDRKQKSPLIYIIDSFYNIDTNQGCFDFDQHCINVSKLRCYLQCVGKTYGQLYGGFDSVSSARPAVFLKTPQQPVFSNACGLYLYLFIHFFMNMTSEEKQRLISLMSSSVVPTNKEYRKVIMKDEFDFIDSETINNLKENVTNKFIVLFENKKKKFKKTNDDAE